MVFRSLENDDFSYVTATYYLLAERVLASCREEQARRALANEQPSLSDLPSATDNIPEFVFGAFTFLMLFLNFRF